jgi:hypothetical protein
MVQRTARVPLRVLYGIVFYGIFECGSCSGITVDSLQCFSTKYLCIFTKFFWVPLAFCIPLTAVSNEPGYILGNALGFASAAHLKECDFSVVDAETDRGTAGLNSVKHHLEVQSCAASGLGKIARGVALRAENGRAS